MMWCKLEDPHHKHIIYHTAHCGNTIPESFAFISSRIRTSHTKNANNADIVKLITDAQRTCSKQGQGEKRELPTRAGVGYIIMYTCLLCL